MVPPASSNDVLVIIISYLDIDSFLTVRLLSWSASKLINARGFFLYRAVAHSTFPGNPRVLLPPEDDVYDLKWLKDLRFKQLAAIVLECGRHGESCLSHEAINTAAESPEADEARAAVAAGWKIFTAFSASQAKWTLFLSMTFRMTRKRRSSQPWHKPRSNLT